VLLLELLLGGGRARHVDNGKGFGMIILRGGLLQLLFFFCFARVSHISECYLKLYAQNKSFFRGPLCIVSAIY
jgi:hypothetical protein